jgi:hypothetical protein
VLGHTVGVTVECIYLCHTDRTEGVRAVRQGGSRQGTSHGSYMHRYSKCSSGQLYVTWVMESKTQDPDQGVWTAMGEGSARR